MDCGDERGAADGRHGEARCGDGMNPVVFGKESDVKPPNEWNQTWKKIGTGELASTSSWSKVKACAFGGHGLDHSLGLQRNVPGAKPFG